MPVENENQTKEQIKNLGQYLPEEKKKELEEILAFGEKYKKEGEEMRDKFRQECRLKYKETEKIKSRLKNLILEYEESEQNFINGLDEEEQEIINRLEGISRNKFYEEYLFDRILYSGDPDKEHEADERVIRDTDKIDNHSEFFKEWKGSIMPGMKVKIGINPTIKKSGIEALAKEWEDSLQPGMNIDLSNNGMGNDGLKLLAREWKNSLKPGMTINLYNNGIGDEGIDALSRERKGKIEVGMDIQLGNNQIGDDGVDAIMHNLELKDGVSLKLFWNNVSLEKKEELKNREETYHKKGINCEVIV